MSSLFYERESEALPQFFLSPHHSTVKGPELSSSQARTLFLPSLLTVSLRYRRALSLSLPVRRAATVLPSVKAPAPPPALSLMGFWIQAQFVSGPLARSFPLLLEWPLHFCTSALLAFPGLCGPCVLWLLLH